MELLSGRQDQNLQINSIPAEVTSLVEMSVAKHDEMYEQNERSQVDDTEGSIPLPLVGFGIAMGAIAIFVATRRSPRHGNIAPGLQQLLVQ